MMREGDRETERGGERGKGDRERGEEIGERDCSTSYKITRLFVKFDFLSPPGGHYLLILTYPGLVCVNLVLG